MDAASLLALLVATLVPIGLTAHAVLYKRDSRTAVAWVGLIWLAPLVGSLVYLMLGVNRIRRTAIKARADAPQLPAPAPNGNEAEPGALQGLANAVEALTKLPLTPGNRVDVLEGKAAYQAMFEAFDAAERSIALSTYIFDNDPAGEAFVVALRRARDRGVEIRILVDAAGTRYTRPPCTDLFDAAGLRYALFFPRRLPMRIMAINLRNHRKIVVVDGAVGFTGGMNIRQGHTIEDPADPTAIQDLHFRLQGPVVEELLSTFSVDWAFCTREVLTGPTWHTTTTSQPGGVLARGIPDGPDEAYDTMRLTLLAALACATKRVVIITPYFIPDPTLLVQLGVTAMRGIQVDLLLPEKNNLPVLPWATGASLPELVERGVRVWFTPPPFDHTKLMLVDDTWSLIGSANWDARSLRLNFEFNVECYDRQLCEQLLELAEKKRGGAKRLTTEAIAQRSMLVRLRDGIADLAAPYL